MIIISHRGNHDGLLVENNPVELPLNRYICEVDLWDVGGNLYLGHDKPQYIIDFDFIFRNSKRILFHAKNLGALEYIINYDLWGFWHDVDKYTLTTKNEIVAYPGLQIPATCAIIMKPELLSRVGLKAMNPYAICTDYPERFECYETNTV